MKASAVIANRRRVGRWLFYALPPDHEDDQRRPAPPAEIKETGPPRPVPEVQPPANQVSSRVREA